MTDLDRRCESQVRALESRIARIDELLPKMRRTRRAAWLEQRNALLIELHDMRRAHRAYDQRLAAAMDDPTGQDLDLFPFSE